MLKGRIILFPVIFCCVQNLRHQQALTEMFLSTFTETTQTVAESFDPKEMRPPNFCLFKYYYHTYQIGNQKGFIINLILKAENNYASNTIY